MSHLPFLNKLTCFTFFQKTTIIFGFFLKPDSCYKKFADDAELTPVLRLGAGACAGIIAMSATYPMDMVRGRITVQVEF